MMKTTLLAASALLIAAPAAQAHFQLAYTPEVNLETPATVPMKFIFWHPLENGHVMDMGEPEALVMIFKGERIDLKPKLKPFTFQGADNKAQAYEAGLDIKRNGDYIVALTPKPYFEKSEDSYIQQITKSFLNKGGIPDSWDKPVGLPTEIVPLVKPTNVLAGSTFSGVVLSEGKPVADTEIEVEFMAAPPDMKANKPGKVTAKAPEGGAIVVKTDASGVFSFGIPRAGFWGFAALGAGPAKEYEGKELSQDAVIWVRAFDFK